MLPVVAPTGTITTIWFSFQLVGVAKTPWKLTVPVPCEFSKPEPEIVTTVPTAPALGERLMTPGASVNTTSSLLVPMPEVTCTGPVWIPAGTTAWIAPRDQLLTLAGTPLNVTVPGSVPKSVPLIVSRFPTVPLLGEIE